MKAVSEIQEWGIIETLKKEMEGKKGHFQLVSGIPQPKRPYIQALDGHHLTL
jgi:hypothetical protein